MAVEILPWVFTSGWASGVNAYAVVLVMGLLGRFAGVDQVPELLTRSDVLWVAAALFAIEAVADKVPVLDSLWDAVHTVIRPAVGAALGYLFGADLSDVGAGLTATAGAVSALASHGVKASLRAAINTSPEPVTNIAVSTAEDVAVASVISLAALNPWLAAVTAAILLVSGAALAWAMWRKIRRMARTYSARHRRRHREKLSGPG